MVDLTNKVNNWVLGITGGIGCGKTAVSNIFKTLGITIVDADIIARQVVELNSQGLNAIKAHFGKDIILSDGTLNRPALRGIIFNNSEEKEWLNNLLHPLIRKEILLQLNTATSKYVVLVAPLLFENKLNNYCHHTLLIDIPKSEQIKRTMSRDNISLEHTLNIIASQMPRAEKQDKADDILDNSHALSQVKKSILVLHQRYLQQAYSHKIIKT
jgi:dephospho-CoA kinase